MSGALNLIIARGFDSPIQGALNSYNNQRQAQEGIESANINQQGAMQNQQINAQEMQARQQADQAGQAKLAELSQRVDRLYQMDPNSPEAQQESRAIAAELALAKGDASAFQSLMSPKPSASQARPVLVQGANGPEWADAESAVGRPAYVRPQAGPTVIQPSYSLVPVQNPDGTVAQTMVNTKDPSDRSVVGNAPAKQNTKTSDAQTSQRTFDAFTKAIGNVEASFAKTDTGPIVGLLPAYTENQQIAEGAVAAMAPILKQLFRSAGEGVFTDKDQALLLDMAPKRTDRPGAAAAKIQAIKDIVAAKLGATTPVQPGETVENAKKYTTASGATVEILD